MRTADQSQLPARRRWLLAVAGCLGLLIIAAALTPAPAAALPPRPPRPTATPTATPAAPAAGRTLLVLALTLQPAASPTAWQTLWTGVQWQDAQGDWHDVEGWQGALDEAARGVGKKTWVVADGHLGSGPYRWLVYARPGGEIIAISRPFHLPAAAGDIYEVKVAVSVIHCWPRPP